MGTVNLYGRRHMNETCHLLFGKTENKLTDILQLQK